MNTDDFAHFRAHAADADVLFFYSGEFSAPVISAAADSLRGRLAEGDAAGPTRRRLFSTFVEMAQNVLHYAADLPSGDGHAPARRGAIGVGRDAGGRHWIACSNAVDAALVPRLTEKLDAVRSMSLEDIKRCYKAQLHNTEHENTDTVSRGAGLGLLTIARDCAELDYSFAPVPGAAQPTVLFHVKALI